MKTSKTWWENLRSNDAVIADWLLRQYYGEVQAAIRIKRMLKMYKLTSLQQCVVTRIANDEAKHAKWIGELLLARGITPNGYTTNRYWHKAINKDKFDTLGYSFSELCAIACHAEEMRLERITVLMQQKEYTDIAKVFAKIDSDEQFHAAAFRAMTTTQDLAKYRSFHELGKQALGLTA